MNYESIKKQAQKLNVPNDYYRGIGKKTFSPPQNILIFYRDASRRKELGIDTNFHYRHVLIFNCGEVIRLMVDGLISTVLEGQFILLFPFQYHRFLNDGQKELSLLFVTFEMDEDRPLHPMRNLCSAFQDDQIEALKKATSLYHEKRGNELTYWLAVILSGLLKNLDLETDNLIHDANDRSPIVSGICIMLYENRKMTIKELSSRLGYSETYLRRHFKEKMGITLGRFILESRLTEAMKYISTTDKTISEIAILTGYENIYSLSRSFKNHIGMSPSQYRKSHK
jgi:AraC-like DNA-binding protein